MTYDRSFTRRDFITTSVALATTLRLQRAAHALGLTPDANVCDLMPEQEDELYVAGELLRSDIVEGKPGVPLDLRLVVLDARTCKALPGAAVDIWHCDALGLYSGFTKESPGGPGGPVGGGPPPGNMGPPPGNMGAPPESHPHRRADVSSRNTDHRRQWRNWNFRTVFPGFYMGRTNHIHFKVRIGGHAGGKSYEAGHTSHIGQVFFPEDVAVRLMQHEPYSKHLIHRTTQAEDGVFGGQHGDLSIARLAGMVHPDDITAGLRANLVAAVDPSATPSPAQRMGLGGPPQA